jgi:ABC-2 type transport system permease protein
VSDLVARRMRAIVQISGLVRKEISQTVRQPQLLFLLVAGPFVILVIFGFGYDEDQMALRTRFVGPTDSIYETAVAQHSDLLSDYVIPAGYTDDLFAARRALELGEIDLIVIFPDEARERIAGGEQAPITILHDKLDPLQLIAVEIAARLAVGEVNATILEALVDEGLEGMRPLSAHLDEAVAAAEEMDRADASGDTAAARRHQADLDRALVGAETALVASAMVLDELAVDETGETRAGIDDLLDRIATLRSDAASQSGSGSARFSTETAALAEEASMALNVPPQVIVRPFYSVTERLGRQHVTPTGFFAPSTIALLLAHLGVTFAAMSVVADRRLGVFETYRVAPLGSPQILTSKYLAFLLLGGIVGAVLLTAVVLALDVPLLGAVVWVAVAVAGLLLASIGLGLIVSALARTDSQAVQYSMLVLLAGLFFGGFFLELDAFAAPVRVLSYLLPVTYAIALLQDVMLRGLDPHLLDLVGLAALTLVYGSGAAVLMRWQLRA